MNIDFNYQVIEGHGKEKFYVGIPMTLLGKNKHQNITDAFVLNKTVEEFHMWMIENGAIITGKNEETGFIVYAFKEKKQASKVARTLTKQYLVRRMRNEI